MILGTVGYNTGQVDPRLASFAGIGPPLAGSTPVPGVTSGTPLTVPPAGAGSLLPPRAVEEIINSANSAINRARGTFAVRPQSRPPTASPSSATPGSLVTPPITVSPLPPSNNTPILNAPAEAVDDE